MKYLILREDNSGHLYKETEVADVAAAVEARELYIRDGGNVIIVQQLDTLEAYAQAAAARRQGAPLTRANYEIEPSRPAATSTPPVGGATGNSVPDPSYDYEGEAARLIAKGHRVIDVPRPAPTKSYEAREVTATGGDA